MIVISFLLAFAIGANDETYASIVGIKRLSVKAAVILGAIVAVIGSFLFAPRICETLQNDVTSLNITKSQVVFAILLAMATSLLLASIFGLPISSTEAMIGAILGVTIIQKEQIYWQFAGLGKIIFTWLVSPIIGFISSFLLMKLMNKVLTKKVTGLEAYDKWDEFFGSAVFVMVIIIGLSRSGNDLCNAIVPIVPFFQKAGANILYQRLPMIIGGIALGGGLILIGRRVLKTLGNEVVKITPETGFITQTTTALIIFISVFLGIPISGTMILVSSVVGAGMGANNPVNFASVKMIALFVLLTPIISGGAAIGYYYLLGAFF
jgi:phosphate/sulfate permease